MFAESRMPAGKLRGSFEASTTLHLRDEDWKVVEARPMTAREYRKTGKLVLILAKLTKGFVDPSTILFSLPTIVNDALPAIAPGTSKQALDVLEIHEDNWRQVEWLPSSAANRIEEELEAVREIYEHHRKGVGFAKCHLRTSVPTLRPDRDILLSDLEAALGRQATWLTGLAYQGVAGIAADSFAVRVLSSIELFGIAPVGAIASICFANTRANNAASSDVEGLSKFAEAHDLLLVDWCRAEIVPSAAENYAAYFRRR